MTQQLDTPLTRLGAARAWLLAACRPCAAERLSLAEAQGAFAAAEIRAPRAAPPADVAVADGVAVASADCLGAAPTAPALLMQRPPAV
ncbi:MAG TPA: molybdopterin-binding protein, partial [Beijerinckiaceae bacterium]